MRLFKLFATLSLVCGSAVAVAQDRYTLPPVGAPPAGSTSPGTLPLGPPPSTSGNNPAPNGGNLPPAGNPPANGNPTSSGAIDNRNTLRGFDQPAGGGTPPTAFSNDMPRAQPINSGASAPAAPPTNDRGYIPTPPNTYSGNSPYGANTATPTTGFTSGAATNNTSYAESLMKASLTAPQGSRLAGTKVYLTDVLRSGGSRSEQSEAIGAYWDLCSAVADYYLSIHEQGEFERLASRSGQMTNPMREALKKLTTRRDTSLVAAQASQLRLAALMRRGDTGSLPLPGDMPLCAVYHTRYSQNFPNGGIREASELNNLLPLRHAELLDAALNVEESQEWFKTVAGRPVDDQGVGMIKALEFLALSRRAFVQIGRDYNKRIARYTEIARPGQLQPDRLVAMLIKTDAMASRPSAPTSPSPRDRSDSGPPSTFQHVEANPLRSSEPRVDDDVQTTSGSIPVAEYMTPGEEPAMVEKPSPPSETSVLIRRGSDDHPADQP